MEYCLDALHQCHLKHGGSDAENVGRAPSAVSALQIARKFAAKASNRLSQQQLHQLIQFLQGPARDKAQNIESLEQSLARKVEEFHYTEVEISGEGRDKLAHPGGPADANLGLTLVSRGDVATKHYGRCFYRWRVKDQYVLYCSQINH